MMIAWLFRLIALTLFVAVAIYWVYDTIRLHSRPKTIAERIEERRKQLQGDRKKGGE